MIDQEIPDRSMFPQPILLLVTEGRTQEQ